MGVKLFVGIVGLLFATTALADYPVQVDNADDLMLFMAEDNTNAHIVIAGGEYRVHQRLFAYGLVESAVGATVTIVDVGVPAPTVPPAGLEISAGVVELGPDAHLRGVTVDARGGNPSQSALHLRGAEGRRRHSVTVEDVVAHGQGQGRAGAVTVFTRQPHQTVNVDFSNSELHGSGNDVIRVINGGQGSRINLTLTNLLIDEPGARNGLLLLAGLNHGGGASNTVTTVESAHNTWTGAGCDSQGMLVEFFDGFIGGVDPTLFAEPQSGTSNGLITIESESDSFVGFGRTISSGLTIGNRPSPSGPNGRVNGNAIKLELEDLTSVLDATCDHFDVELSKPMVVEAAGGVGSSPPPITGNTITLELEGELTRGVGLVEGSCPATWFCEMKHNKFHVE